MPTQPGRAYFDATTLEAFIPTVDVGGQEFAATLALIPGSNPIRFRLTGFHPTAFTGCPSFVQAIGGNACLLQGEIKQNVTLTNNITWVLSGGVFFGGDNTKSVTVTIEPGTKIMGQQAADFFYVRRGSKIKAVGSPTQPIVFPGPKEQTPGEWGRWCSPAMRRSMAAMSASPYASNATRRCSLLTAAISQTTTRGAQIHLDPLGRLSRPSRPGTQRLDPAWGRRWN